MNALLPRLRAAGIKIHAEGDELVVRPGRQLTDKELAYLRENKAQLLAELWAHDEDGREAARDRLRARVESEPELIRAFEVVDPDADPVRVMVAIRGVGSCELLIDAARWDPLEFLRLVHAQPAETST